MAACGASGAAVGVNVGFGVGDTVGEDVGDGVKLGLTATGVELGSAAAVSATAVGTYSGGIAVGGESAGVHPIKKKMMKIRKAFRIIKSKTYCVLRKKLRNTQYAVCLYSP